MAGCIGEWYKAAYHGGAGSYFEYPTATDVATGCVAPASDTGNSANCGGAVNALTHVGAYALSAGPYGSFDQGGNAGEWNEQLGFSGEQRGFRGGALSLEATRLAASSEPGDLVPSTEDDFLGFRVAILLPEPAAALLVPTGALVLAAARRRRA